MQKLQSQKEEMWTGTLRTFALKKIGSYQSKKLLLSIFIWETKIRHLSLYTECISQHNAEAGFTPTVDEYTVINYHTYIPIKIAFGGTFLINRVKNAIRTRRNV